MKALLVALVAAILALAGCSVDTAGQNGNDPEKPTIRIGYQTFPSGDLIVKNNKWLEEALPDYNIKWVKFDSGADVDTAFIAKELNFGALGSSPVARGPEEVASMEWLGSEGNPGNIAVNLESASQFLADQKQISAAAPLKTFQDAVYTKGLPGVITQ